MVDTLKSLKAGNVIVAGDAIFKIAKMGPVQVKHTGSKFDSDACTYELAHIRSCPPAFTSGQLKVDNYGSYKIHRFVEGEFRDYTRLLDRWNLDLTCAAVGEGDWMPTYDIGDLTKLDLMSYVIAVHGPSTRDDIMRRVAALESLPWIPTSNTAYFMNQSGTEGVLHAASKQGRKQLYGLGTEGKKRARVALARLGEGPARAVDGSEPEPTKAVPPIRRK